MSDKSQPTARERLAAIIAEQDAARGRPLTGKEKLANLVAAMTDPTRLWVTTDHDTYWPVGGASIVMANTEAEARVYLDQALRERKLDPTKGYTLVEINISVPFARVLRDGD